MSEVDINSVQFLFKKAHIQALLDNQLAIDRWQKFKTDNEEVQERLKMFLKDMNVPVMIPIGNKAMFKGKLVHTNDILISLGDGYFSKGSVEQALEVSNRRLDKCNEMLESLDKERKLLESRANITQSFDAFPNQGGSEIIEKYDPEEETRWKEEHMKRVKEYKRKLSELKDNEPKVDNVDDLFKRLDLLEMQEELEDELDRLVCPDDDDDYYESSSESSSSSAEEESDVKPEENGHSINNDCMECDLLESTNVDDNCLTSNKECDDDCIRINFKHSSRNPHLPAHDNVINSPADIYSRHCLSMKEERKPFKKVSFLEPLVTKPNQNAFHNDQNIEAFGDVVERPSPSPETLNSSRPVSRFKASRRK